MAASNVSDVPRRADRQAPTVVTSSVSHDIYLVRWTTRAAATGDLTQPEWWCGSVWAPVCSGGPRIVVRQGAPELSVHADGRLAPRPTSRPRSARSTGLSISTSRTSCASPTDETSHSGARRQLATADPRPDVWRATRRRSGGELYDPNRATSAFARCTKSSLWNRSKSAHVQRVVVSTTRSTNNLPSR